MYPDYPDPMPVFSYLGGEAGKGLLESALAQPRQTFQGRFLYTTIPDKAAALLTSMIKNHPFVDGNKRVALTTMVVFFIANHWFFYLERSQAVRLCLEIAATPGNVEVSDVARRLRPNVIRAERWLGMTGARQLEWAEVVAPAVAQQERLIESMTELLSTLGQS